LRLDLSLLRMAGGTTAEVMQVAAAVETPAACLDSRRAEAEEENGHSHPVVDPGLAMNAGPAVVTLL
jgi:hypothetical protein